VGDVLIDLGEMAPRGRTPIEASAPDRRPSHRALLAGLTLILVALLTGAVHHGPPPPPTFIDARIGDMMYVSTDRVFVVRPGPELAFSAVQNKIVSEYRLPTGDLLSQTTVGVAGVIFDVQVAGPVLLVSYQVDTDREEATVALTVGTGEVRWRRPVRVLSASAAQGVVLLRENTAKYGKVDWYGVDLLTGEVRWSLRQPVRGIVEVADFVDGFPQLLVSATTAGNIEIRDVASGAVTAAAKVTLRSRQAGADLPIWLTGDQVLVGVPDGTTAYALPDLAELWHSPADLAGRWVQEDCVGTICSLNWQGGIQALDPATGLRRWADSRWNYVDQVGAYLLASDNSGREPSRVATVVDPANGRILGDFGPWRATGAARDDGTVLGLRPQVDDETLWYALLDPRTLGVRVLGAADRVAGDCRPTKQVLVCRRLDASVGIWHLG
jgi:hypothetical protein